MSAYRRHVSDEELMEKIKASKSTNLGLKKSELPAVKFGNDFEDEARQKYCEVYPNRDVQQVGLVIKDKFSFFGASPDGIITFKGGSGTRGGYYGILEIKCIYSCRDKEKIEGCKFLNKKGQLLRGSRYYTQVQLCAWATGAKFIHFFLWTKHDYKLVPVPLDPEFAQKSIKLSEYIYFDKYLPALCQ